MPYFYVNIVMLTDVTDHTKVFIIFDYLPRCRGADAPLTQNIDYAIFLANRHWRVNSPYLLVNFVQLTDVIFYVFRYFPSLSNDLTATPLPNSR